jgi:hypothetical protein
MRLSSVLAAAVTTTLLVAVPTSADAATSVTYSDRVGDAPSSADIRWVKINKSKRWLVTTIRLRSVVRPGRDDSSLFWIHYDTTGSRSPDYLFAVPGMEWLAGSARGWFRVRAGSEPEDAYGDWGPCLRGRRPYTYSRSRDTIRVRIPMRCFDGASRVRVAVNTDYGEHPDGRHDWFRRPGQYSRWLR